MKLLGRVVLGIVLLTWGGQAVPAHAQPGGSSQKVKWTVQGDTLAPGDTGAVTLRAAIAAGWKMYAPDSPPPTVGVRVDLGPETSEAITTGPLQHPEPQTTVDPNFGKTIQFFQGATHLHVPVALSAEARSGAHSVEGTVRFMVCTSEICLPPTTERISASILVADP